MHGNKVQITKIYKVIETIFFSTDPLMSTKHQNQSLTNLS